MAIADDLEKLASDLSDAYDAIEAKGGTIPEHKNTDSLPTAIGSIEGGGGDTGFGIDMFLLNGLYGLDNVDADRLTEDKVFIGYTLVGYEKSSLSASGFDIDAAPYGGDVILTGVTNFWSVKSIAEGIKQVAREAGEDISQESVTFCLQYDDRYQTWWGGIGGGTFYEITSAKMSELGWDNFWFTPNSEKITGPCQWALPDGYSSEYFVVVELGSSDGIVEGYSTMNYAEVDAETFKNDIFPHFFGNVNGSQTIILPGYDGDVIIPIYRLAYIIIGDGVADSDLPQWQSGDRYFMANCRHLFLFYGLDRILNNSSDVTLGAYFLWRCSRFNQPIDLSNVKTIQWTFMCYCESYNQKIVIPANIQFVGNYLPSQGKYAFNFLDYAFAMCSEIEMNSAPIDSDLISSDESFYGWAGPAITRGIKITGPYKDAWLAKFPNRPGSRNLR